MSNVEPLLTAADYERALKEVEVYFDNQPASGTEAAHRFVLLSALIKDYEDRHFPMPEFEA